MTEPASGTARIDGPICRDGFGALHEAPALARQQDRHRQRDYAKDREDCPPAEELPEHAAQRAADDLADHQRAHEPGQRDLTRLVGELVADVPERHRDDRGGRDPGQEAEQSEHRDARHEGAGECPHREHRQAPGHHAQFADPIAQRTVEQLEQSVRQRIRRDHDGGVRRGGGEVPRDHVQQRVDHPGVGLNHERGQAEHEQRRPFGGCRDSGRGGGIQGGHRDDAIWHPAADKAGRQCRPENGG